MRNFILTTRSGRILPSVRWTVRSCPIKAVQGASAVSYTHLNDDAIRAIKLIAQTMLNAVTEGRQGDELTVSDEAVAEKAEGEEVKAAE